MNCSRRLHSKQRYAARLFYMSSNIPLVVDLDGTLVYDDTLYVLARKIIREQPFNFLMLPFKLLNCKAAMKEYMSSINRISPRSLSYNQSLIDWLFVQKKRRAPSCLVYCFESRYGKCYCQSFECI